jgi:hypothetical protein
MWKPENRGGGSVKCCSAETLRPNAIASRHGGQAPRVLIFPVAKSLIDLEKLSNLTTDPLPGYSACRPGHWPRDQHWCARTPHLPSGYNGTLPDQLIECKLFIQRAERPMRQVAEFRRPDRLMGLLRILSLGCVAGALFQRRRSPKFLRIASCGTSFGAISTPSVRDR